MKTTDFSTPPASPLKNERHTSSSQITRVYVDRQEREAGYLMRSYHCHPYYELSYIERGSCRFMTEDGMYDLHDGDFYLVPPNRLHYTRYLLGSCRRCGIYFRAEDLSPALLDVLPKDFLRELRFLQVPPARRRLFDQLIARMAEEEAEPDAHSELMLRLLLQELLLHVLRDCSIPQMSLEPIHTTDRQVLQAARFINEHFRQPITAADIAAAAGFSPNYLSRKFREAAGIGIHEYLVFIRLRTAALELSTTEHSITEIALHCGFSDSNYFKDAFKKKYGMTPREYRKAR